MKQFKLGQSNPTFLILDADEKKLVVRKKPPGSLLSKTAHAIDREYRVLKALNSTNVPVPKVFHYCKDVSVIGTEFYVMEFLDGRIFSDVLLPTVNISEKKSYYQSIIKSLALLHSVDFSNIGLEGYGREGGFYERQLSSLYKLSIIQSAVKGDDGVEVGELYRLSDIMKWLSNNLVKDQVTLIHGDFKTDNIVFDPKTKNVIGILDWELYLILNRSTIGHPLSDLANLVLPWYLSSKFGKLGGIGGLLDHPRPLDVPEADELIQQYCSLRNIKYPIPNWNFCVAFSFFRLAVITQGIAARVKRKQASSGFAEEVAKLFQPMSMQVYQIATSKSKI